MAAKKTIKRKPQMTKVTESCGCVFCDIELKPIRRDGQLMHHVQPSASTGKPKQWVPCLRRVIEEHQPCGGWEGERQ